jgi:hypothetical protein
MDYTVVSIIATREKNTRYLVQNSDGEYFSIKVPTGRYQIGDLASEAYYEPCVNEKWIKTSKGPNNSYPRGKMIDHLKWYKLEVLHDEANGLYQNRPYSHILNSPEKNLIRGFGYDDSVSEMMRSLGEELRSDFTHLTSSQAFAVNFFTPLIKEKKLSLLHPCFDFQLPNCSFEEICPKEDQTQFDFFVTNNARNHTCSVEVKYSESGFGSTIGDTKHLDKFINDYEKKMEVLADVPQNEWQFFEYYQVWRNLLYTVRHPGQHICFLFPRFREDLKKTLEEIFAKCKEQYRPFFHIIVADDIIEDIIQSDSPMKSYYEEFRLKYLDIDLV